MMASLYAQTSGQLKTSSATFEPIPGLTFHLPQGVADMAIVTLNLPNPYATGNNYPGGVFRIAVDGTPLPVWASFSYPVKEGSSARVPTTLIVGVPLTMTKQSIQAMWHSIRGGTVHLDSPATLSAAY
jgi:hypothetical protein